MRLSVDGRPCGCMSDLIQSQSLSDLPQIAGLMGDKALWLRLVDPEYTEEARDELVESINDPSTFLRRLALGLQFGVDIDLEWAEREVDRLSALSGGTSPDAAFARLGLALSKKSHAAVAGYINEHRDQLSKHLERRGLHFLEIEMLAHAGQTAKAEERLKKLRVGDCPRETLHGCVVNWPKCPAETLSPRDWRRTRRMGPSSSCVC